MSNPFPKLGKYAILQEIGRGGMGAVYKGQDTMLERTVAIKVLAPHLVWEKTFLERFMREARSAARLNHPNIVPIHDVGQDGSNYYYVMAYLPGPSLKQRLAERGRLPLQETLAILRPLAGALDYAHSKSLVHRDVKPANVLFGERGEATLTDFGIVKALEESQLTSGGHSLGTPRYMAPEQIQGHGVDGRTDQYALAIVAYEMLSGRVPFDAATTTAILYKHVHEAPPPVTSVYPQLPRAVDGVLARALSKQPAARYASCSEFVEALAQALISAIPQRGPRQRATRQVANVAPQNLPRTTTAVQPSTSPATLRPAGERVEASPATTRAAPAAPVQPAHKPRPYLKAVIGGLLGLTLVALAIFVLPRTLGKHEAELTPAPTRPPVAAQQLATEPTLTPVPTRPPQVPLTQGGELAGAPDFAARIALLAPLSGDARVYGESVRRGVELALDEARAAGWRVELVLADSLCQGDTAVKETNRLVSVERIHYLIGDVCSNASIPVSEIAEASQVLQISPASSSPNVTVFPDGRTKRYVFRACFLDPFQGQVMARLAWDLGARTAATLFVAGDPYVEGLAAYFAESFEQLGGVVPVRAAYGPEDTDLAVQLNAVIEARPDVLFLPDYYYRVNRIADQIKARGIKVLLLGADGWDSAQLDRRLFEGAYFSNHYSPTDPRPVVHEFVVAYREKYDAMPDALAALGYDTAKMLLRAISEAGMDDPTAVGQKLAAMHYEGVTGEISFDAQHNPRKAAAIVKIADGEFTFFRFATP